MNTVRGKRRRYREAAEQEGGEEEYRVRGSLEIRRMKMRAEGGLFWQAS